MSSPTTLVKGQNAPLGASSIVVTVELAAPADLSALLVTAGGKVRSDADFIFFNQPDGPGVHCRQPEPGRPWRIDLDLPQIPATIEAVRVVVTLEDAGARFGSLPAPVATVSDPAGQPLVRYEATGLSSESIVIAIEVYRRGVDWKVRAVGQGYAGGLADLIADHGVSVDDPGPAAPQAPPAAVPPPVTAPPVTPPPVTPPPAPSPPVAPAAAYPPPPAFPPPPVGVPQPDAVLPTALVPPTRTTGEVSLVKGRSVSLQKGQRVSLRKEDGVALTTVRMGLGWDPIKKKGMFGGGREVDIDLDASALLFTGAQVVDVVFFNSLRSKDGSVRHLGDNLTGEGEGDDESIVVDLRTVAAQVTGILFVVTSYRGQTFEQVANAFCRLVDQTNNGELARYTLGGGQPFTGMVMAKVFRDSGNWKLQAIGEGIQARTPIDAISKIGRFL